MSHVFICYSREDTEIMQRIKESLKARGLQVWTDENLEVATPNWQSATEKAIENSVCLVCILTTSAKDSRWVREQMVYAGFHNKLIYAVSAKGETGSIALSLGFNSSQTIDISDESLYNPRMDTLANLIHTHNETRSDTIETLFPIGTKRIPTSNKENYTPVETAVNELILSTIPTYETHQLIVQRGKEFTAQTTYDINDTLVIIGRSAKSTLLINDVSVSREHLQLVYTAEGFLIHDMDSTNGTYVNNRRILTHRLQSNDEIQIGPNVSLLYKQSLK